VGNAVAATVGSRRLVVPVRFCWPARQIGKYEEAIADCTRSLEIDPDFVKVLLRRADLYLKTEKYQEAVNDLEKAQQLDSGNSGLPAGRSRGGRGGVHC